MLFKTVSPDTVFILKNNPLEGKQWLGQIELKDNEWRAWVNPSSGWWSHEQLLRLTAKVETLNTVQRALAHAEESFIQEQGVVVTSMENTICSS